MNSALYVGTVQHRRLKPRAHRLRYRVFWLLVDLDELPALGRRLRLFSHNRFNLFALDEADHGDGKGLRAHVERTLAAAGIDLGGGRIRLFAMPRMLGYVFNPLSIYFCHRADGGLAAILYEVRNTFGEMHSYLIPAADADRTVRQSCRKEFYVSPFMDMQLRYDFRIALPDARVSVAIAAHDEDGPVLTASLSGERRALTDRALARLLVTHPLLTLKVMAAIHWEALKLFGKGLRLRLRPSPPPAPVTASAGEERF